MINQELTLDQQKNDLLKQIFIIRSMKVTDAAKKIWKNDLARYSAKTVLAAWDDWRNLEKNHAANVKPTSEQIAAICRRLDPNSVKLGISPFYAADNSLQYGRSAIEDKIKADCDRAHKNNPNLLNDLKQCHSIYEKLVVCSLAQGTNQENLRGFKNLIEKWDKANKNNLKCEKEETNSTKKVIINNKKHSSLDELLGYEQYPEMYAS